MDVAYSYVNIGISEVMEYRQDSEPVRRNTFADRLKNTLWSTGRGFVSFLEGILFLVIRLSPYILIIAVICFAFFRNKIKKFAEEQKVRKEERNARRALRSQNITYRMTEPMPNDPNTGWQTPSAAPMPQDQNTDWQTPPAGQPPQGTQPSVQEAGQVQIPHKDNNEQ